MQKSCSLFIPLFLVFLLPGCMQETDRQEETQALIRQTAEERLANYEKIRTERCLKNILDEATSIADSLLIDEARANKLYSNRPLIPAKPARPEIQQLQDTTPLRPLLPEEDSLIVRDSSQG